MTFITYIASSLIIITMGLSFVITGVFLFSDQEWGFKLSPRTGVCYETYAKGWGFSVSYNLSPVDPSYCEEKKP